MSVNLKKLFNDFLLVALLLLSCLLLARVFFEKQFTDFFVRFSPVVQESHKIDQVKVSGLYAVDQLNLNSLDPYFRYPASYVYEPLIDLDANLNLQPALALSWGQLDDLTWQFKLRHDVRFHDGDVFVADDVLYSFNHALKDESGDLLSMLSFIDSVEKVDEFTVIFHLKAEDNLMLYKLSKLLIVSKDSQSGTGAYVIVSGVKPGDDALHLRRFDSYWGSAVNVNEILMTSESSDEQLLSMLDARTVDVVQLTSAKSISALSENYNVVSEPALQMSFLLFNNEKAFSNPTLAEIFNLFVDRSGLSEYLGGEYSPLEQFASRGVLGYVSNYHVDKMDVFKAKKLVSEFTDLPVLTFDYLDGMDAMAEYLANDLEELGFSITKNSLSFDEMKRAIVESDADLYLLNWKFDVPDVSEFLRNFAYSKGELNGSNYYDKSTDSTLEKVFASSNTVERGKILKGLMTKLLNDKNFGMALLDKNYIFVSQKNFVLRPDLSGNLDLSQLTTY